MRYRDLTTDDKFGLFISNKGIRKSVIDYHHDRILEAVKEEIEGYLVDVVNADANMSMLKAAIEEILNIQSLITEGGWVDDRADEEFSFMKVVKATPKCR